MSSREDQYERDGEGQSHLRDIIRQLNDDNPSKEKSREVVIRADGTKMVRVIKKRRVMVSEEEKSSRSKRHFLLFLFAVFVGMVAFGSFVAYRMISMSGETYLASCGEKLKHYWGADSVQCVGMDLDGSEWKVDAVRIAFPNSSPVAAVEIGGLKADINSGSFFSGILAGEKMTMDRVKVILRPSYRRLYLPKLSENTLWHYARYECKDFSVVYEGEDEEAAPFRLSRSSAYMYGLPDRNASYSLIISGGDLRIEGWKTLRIKEGKWLITPLGVEELSLEGTTDSEKILAAENQSSVVITGSISSEASLATPLRFESNNMAFADLTRARFSKFLQARTSYIGRSSDKTESFIVLPFEDSEPTFYGKFDLKNIILSSFPAIRELVGHLESQRRAKYQPINVFSGVVGVKRHGGISSLVLEDGDVVQRDVVSLKGELTVSEDHELSGTLSYGLPARYTHAEYPDGLSDPIFEERGDTAWLHTRVSGFANAPTDDIGVLEARAQVARASRPPRQQLDDINIDRVVQGYQEQQKASTEAPPADAPSAKGSESPVEIQGEEKPAPAAPRPDAANPFDDPFYRAEDDRLMF